MYHLGRSHKIQNLLELHHGREVRVEQEDSPDYSNELGNDLSIRA